MSGVLAGIRILDLTSVLMGPSATQHLAELGADVIKVEAPTGDTTRGIGPGRSPGMGSNFLNMNRGKRSIALDLKQPAGREALLALAAKADALVHNVRPQAMKRLGLDYPALRAANAGIVYCALSGFGEGGPYAGQPAYDDLIQGLSALPALIGKVVGEPHYVPTPIADRVAGLTAAFALTAALLHRVRTGEGQEVEVPMFESMAHVVLSDHFFGRTFEPPLGPPGYVRLLSKHRHPYRTKDGWLCTLIYTDRHWQSYFKLTGRPDLAADARFADMRSRNDNIDELYGIVAREMATRTTAEWTALLREADIPVGTMHDLDSLIEDPHLAAVGFFRQVDHPTEGPIRTMRGPVRWSASDPGLPCAAPRLGEHSVELLREAGLSEARIGAMLRSGAAVANAPEGKAVSA